MAIEDWILRRLALSGQTHEQLAMHAGGIDPSELDEALEALLARGWVSAPSAGYSLAKQERYYWLTDAGREELERRS